MSKDPFEDSLSICPVCHEKKLEICSCENFVGFASPVSYVGLTYEVDCLKCGAHGEGDTVELAMKNIKESE